MTVTRSGLSSDEAAARLKRDGPNTLPEPAFRPLAAFASRFWGVVPAMLEAAIALDLWLQRWLEAAMIAVLLLFQAVLGTMQERRARVAMALLRSRVTVNARVQRDGRWQLLPARDLVVDDLVELRAGDIAPADLRLLAGSVSVDVSQLTGESLPVDVAAGAEVAAASIVRRGEAMGVVVATGARTRYGHMASLLGRAQAPGRLQLLTVRLARVLLAVDLALIALVLAAAWWHGSLGVAVLPFVLMLMVASVPVAMPAMSTLSATLGARALADQGVLATRLAAVEAAASMDVLCLDKTGTITENRLAVHALRPAPGVDEAELLRLAAWASDEATLDPIDRAVIAAARSRGFSDADAERLAWTPFDPETKLAAAELRRGGQTLRAVKGEPHSVAAFVGAEIGAVSGAVTALAADGARVIAVGVVDGNDARLAGLIALADPVREDSAALVAALQQQGVRVLLVTGDGEATARAVARRVGIEGEVAPPGAISASADAAALARYAVFARVLPEDKLRLVQALQRGGSCVGMSGDGVNDAPALAQADVGIAVANATDIARAAASLLLTRPGLADIVAAIRVSRSIYQRMQSWVLAMISRKTGVPGFLALGVVLYGSFAISPLLMVLFMLAGDIATFALSADRVTPSRRPDHWRMARLTITGLALGAVLLVASLVVYRIVPGTWRLDEAQVHTMTFVWLVFAAGQAVLYAVRSRDAFWQPPAPGRALLVATGIDVVLASALAIQGWLMMPIPPAVVFALFVAALALLVALDLVKRLAWWLGRRPSAVTGTQAAPAT
jgi:H+-transporting ATPase